ncbi:hypothetical protein BRC81_08625 [Halobacteriales archaeon QS_1_68_20]|nr:MAG: hypothetical protein BRC81_08625 [Halobacteriales archaeon QS_1_68_20]
MNAWELVVAYLVVFVLLQFLIYRYVGSDDDGSPRRWGQVPNAEAGPPTDPSVDRESPVDRDALDRTTRADHLDEAAHADVDGGRRCPTCGVRNESEPVYEYCRHCGGRLGR